MEFQIVEYQDNNNKSNDNSEEIIETFERNVCKDGSECPYNVRKTTNRDETFSLHQDCCVTFVKFGLEHFVKCDLLQKASMAIGLGFSMMWDSVNYFQQPDALFNSYTNPDIFERLENVMNFISTSEDPYAKLHHKIIETTYFELKAIKSGENWGNYKNIIVKGWSDCIQRTKKLLGEEHRDQEERKEEEEGEEESPEKIFISKFFLPFQVLPLLSSDLSKNKTTSSKVQVDLYIPPIFMKGDFPVPIISPKMKIERVLVSSILRSSPKKILSNLFVKRRYWTLHELNTNLRSIDEIPPDRITSFMVTEDLKGLEIDPTNFYLLDIVGSYYDWFQKDELAHNYFQKCVRNSPWDWKKRAVVFLEVIRSFLRSTSIREHEIYQNEVKKLDEILGRISKYSVRKKMHSGEGDINNDDRINSIEKKIQDLYQIHLDQNQYLRKFYGRISPKSDSFSKNIEIEIEEECEIEVKNAMKLISKVSEMERFASKKKKLASLETVQSCSFCGKSFPNMKRCSRCRKTVYCGVECQKRDWFRGHKNDCKIKN